MRMVDLIEKKQQGQSLSQEEIQWIVSGLSQGSIPDYQVSAWMMAIYFQGMSDQEAAWLTEAMAASGDQLDLSAIDGVKVDKHSTGGVGDTTTIILAPLVAACGVPVAKMSGRGLGHTGGTIDKLEAIPGFQTDLTIDGFINQVNEIGLAIAGQTGDLTPADKKMYSLRDVTGTVNSIPLIASSIMSKKIAAGADAIVLDVKVGDGAFMKTVDQARQLAETMVKIGNHVGRRTLAVISDMSQPLGHAVGNALEIREAIETLKGQGPEDLTELCRVLGSQMLLAAGRVEDLEAGRALLQDQMDSGAAIDTFKAFVAAQGGDVAVVDNPSLLASASYQIEVKAQETGYISQWVAHEVGVAASLLGAGRSRAEDTIDPAVGILIQKKVGDVVAAGDVLAIIHANQAEPEEVIAKLQAAVTISQDRETPSLIQEIIGL